MLALPPHAAAYLFHTKAGVRNLLLCKLSLYSRLFPSWFHFKSRTSQRKVNSSDHTIRKVKFLSKNSILTKPQHFHEFFTQFFFWQFFSWNQSCQQLKSPKPKHFHEFLTPEKSTIFSGNQSWFFGQKMKISNSVAKWDRFNFKEKTKIQKTYRLVQKPQHWLQIYAREIPIFVAVLLHPKSEHRVHVRIHP